jgi:hypothetical protein
LTVATKLVEWKGGDAFKSKLRQMATKLGTAGAVQVGFFPDARYTAVHPIRGTKRKPLPVAQVAFWNQWGAPKAGIPARPFFSTAIKDQSGHWGKDMAHFAKLFNYDSSKVLAAMGKSIQEDVVHMIVSWSQPGNSARTAAIKGFNKPLVDDGTMQRKVAFLVTR